jgi:hypothetical protein
MPTVTSRRAPDPVTDVGTLRDYNMTAPSTLPLPAPQKPNRPTSAHPLTLSPAPVGLARMIGQVSGPAAPDALSSAATSIGGATASADAQRRRATGGSIFALPVPTSSVPAPTARYAPPMLVGA